MKTAFLWIAFVLSIICLVELSHAHPADDPCVNGEYVSFGCQLIAPHLGLNNPAMFAKHKEYWHCRRDLEQNRLDYRGCLDTLNYIHAKRGLPMVHGLPICLDYHQLIPATPIVERPTDLVNAQNQINACNANVCGAHLYACEQYLGAIW